LAHRAAQNRVEGRVISIGRIQESLSPSILQSSILEPSILERMSGGKLQTIAW
jgi:two-component sensor histidine kinase